ncbi:MAG: MurR/RpiR family transcriptional regulator [Spirochaetia bacterium]|nr:MurR/RpiR family transcriptional regulator [Spirochaetia bacterium]
MDKMEGSCLYLITQMYHNLSVSHKLIADYILNNPEKAVELTIDKLALQIGTSESTLVRFVRKIGYSGYQYFRLSLATEIIPVIKRLYERELREEDHIIPLVFNSAISTLNATQDILQEEVINEVAKKLMSARCFSMFGLGGSYIVALDGFHKFIRLGVNIKIVEDFHMQLMIASQFQKGDVALIYSHTGVNIDSLSIVRELKKQQAYIISITSNPHSLIATESDLVLPVHVKNNGVISEAFSARIAQMAINDVLYLSLLRQNEEEAVVQLEKMQSVISKRRI